jgi:hypothetical protein
MILIYDTRLRMYNKRPSVKELTNKLRQAKEALAKGSKRFVDPVKVMGELNSLEIDDSEEVFDLIGKLLDEIVPADYAGGRPPQRSYEQGYEGKELFAFAWESQILGKRMYLKFIIFEECFYYVSLHKDNPKEKI